MFIFITTIFFLCIGNISCLPSLQYRAIRTNSVHLLEGVALEMYRTGSYRSAISAYKKILRLSAKNPEKYQKNADWALYEIGFCYLKLGRKKLALHFFKKVAAESSLAKATILSEQRIKQLQQPKHTLSNNIVFPINPFTASSQDYSSP